MMEIKVGGGRYKIRKVDTRTLIGYIEIQGAKWGSSGITEKGGGAGTHGTQSKGKSRSSQSAVKTEFLIDKWWISDKIKFKYADKRLLNNLSEEMGRTRRLERSINHHIPKNLESLYNKRESLDKKSPHYNRSYQSLMNRIKDEKLKLKEYKYELKYRKRIVFNISKMIIPSISILRRDKYGMIQCKWRFMGKERTRIHLGQISDIGHLSNDKLKSMSIKIIQKKFSEPLDTLTKGWIKEESNKLNKWYEDLGYKVRRD